MAEFTIFPAYRRKHYALDAARMILTDHPGKWEIKHLNEEETVLVFEVGEQLWYLRQKG